MPTLGAPSFKELNVGNPEFFKQVNSVIESEPLDALKTYVSWQVLRAAAPWLSQPLVDTNFKLRQALTGQKQIQDRWKRCVDLVDGNLGEALGQRYVEATFGADGKQRMLKMVGALEESLDSDIQSLNWMSDDTGKQAKVKLQAIRTKSGTRTFIEIIVRWLSNPMTCWVTWSAPRSSNRNGRSQKSASRWTAWSGA